MDTERRDIPGCDGQYQIDREGNVYAMFYHRGAHPGWLKTTRLNKDGYVSVTLNIGMRYIHRLLMLTFHPIDNPHEMEVNHIDLNKSNNDLSNLEWVTHRDNIRHAHKMNAWAANGPKGETTITAKLTDSAVRQIRVLWQAGATYRALGVQYGVSYNTIRDVIIGRSWGHVK